MTITPELQEAISAIAIQAMEQHRQDQKRSQTMYQRICRDLETQLECCMYDRTEDIPHDAGTSIVHRDMRNKVRSAIGTLLITSYRVDRIAQLPVDREDDIREFVQDVLALVATHRPDCM